MTGSNGLVGEPTWSPDSLWINPVDEPASPTRLKPFETNPPRTSVSTPSTLLAAINVFLITSVPPSEATPPALTAELFTTETASRLPVPIVTIPPPAPAEFVETVLLVILRLASLNRPPPAADAEFIANVLSAISADAKSRRTTVDLSE